MRNTKGKFKEYYVFIFIGILGALLILASLYFYLWKSSPRVDDRVMDLTADQLSPDVFCKLVEKGLEERTSTSWNCSASNDTYNPNNSKLYDLTEALCECSAVINNTPMHIQVRRSKK